MECPRTYCRDWLTAAHLKDVVGQLVALLRLCSHSALVNQWTLLLRDRQGPLLPHHAHLWRRPCRPTAAACSVMLVQIVAQALQATMEAESTLSFRQGQLPAVSLVCSDLRPLAGMTCEKAKVATSSLGICCAALHPTWLHAWRGGPHGQHARHAWPRLDASRSVCSLGLVDRAVRHLDPLLLADWRHSVEDLQGEALLLSQKVELSRRQGG